MKITKNDLKKLIKEELTKETMGSTSIEEERGAHLEDFDTFLHNLFVYGEPNSNDAHERLKQLIGDIDAAENPEYISKLVIKALMNAFKSKEAGVMKRAGYR